MAICNWCGNSYRRNWAMWSLCARCRKIYQAGGSSKEVPKETKMDTKRYVITEVWVRHSVVNAESIEDAYNKSEPEPREGLSLSNWHVAAVGDGDQPLTGGLNYRQVPSDGIIGVPNDYSEVVKVTDPDPRD